MKVPTLLEMSSRGEKPEVVFWIGCAGSFDDRSKKITKENIKIKDIGKNLRLCLTGSGSSIDLITILDILGIEEIIRRLSYNVDRS